MTTPAPDLSKLRINRDSPAPGVRRALVRNLVLAALAVVVIGGIVVFTRGGGGTVVQVAVAAVVDGGSSAGAGAASVTANGYVVARTRA